MMLGGYYTRFEEKITVIKYQRSCAMRGDRDADKGTDHLGEYNETVTKVTMRNVTLDGLL